MGGCCWGGERKRSVGRVREKSVGGGWVKRTEVWME